jgi:hypothetical protein
VAPTADGGFLIAHTWNNRVRRVAPDGTITTAAGSGVHQGDQLEGLGDGGPAAAASLDGPSGVATMPDAGFVIADTGNHRIRRVSPNGTISTVAGTDQGFSGDGGLATKGRLASPRGVAVGPGGYVLIADSLNDRVRRVGRDGRISTVAGSGTHMYSGTVLLADALRWDGEPAAAAILDAPTGLAVTPEHGLFAASADGVRFVVPPGTPRLAVAVLAGGGRASLGGYRARVITTVPAHVTIEARGASARVRAEGDAAAGSPATITLNRRFAPGVYTVAAAATTEAGAVATHRTRLILGGTLPRRVAKRAVAGVATPGDAGEDDNYSVGRCRRFGPRRVDCEIKHRFATAPTSCSHLIAVRLTASGLLRARLRVRPSRSGPVPPRPPVAGEAILDCSPLVASFELQARYDIAPPSDDSRLPATPVEPPPRRRTFQFLEAAQYWARGVTAVGIRCNV